MSDLTDLRVLHAKYHDMPGNLYGRDECGYTRCDFWDAAIFLDLAQDETADPYVAERIAQIRRTALRVKPVDVGVFRTMLPNSVADLMAIAPVDLAWLCALAAPSVSQDETADPLNAFIAHCRARAGEFVAPGCMASAERASWLATAAKAAAFSESLPASPVSPGEPEGSEQCKCFVTPEETWTRYGSAVEPGSQMEPNPDCRVHFPAAPAPVADDAHAQAVREAEAKVLREALGSTESPELLCARLRDAADRLENPRHRGNQFPWPEHSRMFRSLAAAIKEASDEH